MKVRTIGKLAKELNVSVETIRYYEKRNLIKQPRKPENGYRHYPDTTVKQLRFILQAKKLGFTLQEISVISQTSTLPCNELEQFAKAKSENIQHKIEGLREIQSQLERIINDCKNNSQKENCPLLITLTESS